MSAWKTIPRYPNYEASSEGEIRRKHHRFDASRPGDALSKFVGKKGYVRVCVENHTQFIAPLVCEAFHGLKPSPAHQAAHRDGDKANNSPDNLAWLTQSENYQDSVRHGTHRKGERCGHAKLTEADVRRIRDIANLYQQKDIAKLYGISISAISRIVLRQTWGHV